MSTSQCFLDAIEAKDEVTIQAMLFSNKQAVLDGAWRWLFRNIGSHPSFDSVNIETVKTLANLGADLESGISGNGTALFWAAFGDNVELVRALLEAGADPNYSHECDSNINTTLQNSLSRYDHVINTQIVGLLIQAGAYVDGDGQYLSHTPLMLAIEEGNLEVVNLLVNGGANIDAVYDCFLPEHSDDTFEDYNIYKSTPLMVSIIKKRNDIAKYLIEQGADINMVAYWNAPNDSDSFEEDPDTGIEYDKDRFETALSLAYDLGLSKVFMMIIIHENFNMFAKMYEKFYDEICNRMFALPQETGQPGSLSMMLAY